jgi:hypothetical protein
VADERSHLRKLHFLFGTFGPYSGIVRLNAKVVASSQIEADTSSRNQIWDEYVSNASFSMAQIVGASLSLRI